VGRRQEEWYKDIAEEVGSAAKEGLGQPDSRRAKKNPAIEEPTHEE
jgi:hypothetical protein